MHFETFIIVVGDNPGEVWCQSSAETLAGNLHECATDTKNDGEDVRLIRVYQMTEIRVEPNAFRVDNVGEVLKSSAQ